MATMSLQIGRRAMCADNAVIANFSTKYNKTRKRRVLPPRKNIHINHFITSPDTMNSSVMCLCSFFMIIILKLLSVLYLLVVLKCNGRDIPISLGRKQKTLPFSRIALARFSQADEVRQLMIIPSVILLILLIDVCIRRAKELDIIILSTTPLQSIYH